jgi:hypothetical protein
MEELILAKERYYNKNVITEKDFNLNLENFLLKIYTLCDPFVYGTQWDKWLIKIVKKENLYVGSVDKSEERGDMNMSYPKTNNNPIQQTEEINLPFYYGSVSGTHYGNVVLDVDQIQKYFENKISFLGKTSQSYTIRNIRPYHNIDYFMLCFVDCEDNFKPHFICIDKTVLTDNRDYRLSYMNGTKKSNENNENCNMGVTIKKNSPQYKRLINVHNKLKGTSINDMLEFLFSLNISLRDELLNSFDEYSYDDLNRDNNDRVLYGGLYKIQSTTIREKISSILVEGEIYSFKNFNGVVEEMVYIGVEKMGMDNKYSFIDVGGYRFNTLYIERIIIPKLTN